jgi:hypothetical protein
LALIRVQNSFFLEKKTTNFFLLQSKKKLTWPIEGTYLCPFTKEVRVVFFGGNEHFEGKYHLLSNNL